jgi:hypothetical protein
MAIKLMVVIIKAYQSNPLHREFYLKFFSEGQLHIQMELLGIIGLDFNVIGKLLITYSAFVMYLRRSGNVVWLYIRHLYTLRKPVSVSNSAGLKVHPYQPWLCPQPVEWPRH